MKDVYIVDYVVIDTLGDDIASNYANMKFLAKGPQPITRYNVNQYPNVLSTKGYQIPMYQNETGLYYKLQTDLAEQLEKNNEKFPADSAVIVGSFASSGHEARQPFVEAMENGNMRFSPTKLFVNNSDLISAIIAKRFKLEGFSTSLNAACSTSMFNLHYAFACIQLGMLSSAIVGSVETPLAALTQYYWQSTSAISTTDGGVCRPFDKSRDGFLQAEGGTLWFICDKETVDKYNLKPKAKLLSIAAAAKCHDSATMTAHDKTCQSQIAVINQAFNTANKKPSDMAFFNAHATSTLIGDDIELEVFQKVFHDINIPCVSFKGYLGHTMSACGMIESAYGIEAIKNGYLHPNYDLKDPISDDPRLITETTAITGNIFMKASFGFGGRSVAAIIEKI